MYKTEKEIFSQYQALEKTYQLMIEKKEELKEFFRLNKPERIVLTGCGSSYSLCKSAAATLKKETGIECNAIAAGDLMINFDHYRRSLENAIVIAPSRSGSTSELVYAVKKIKETMGAKCICIAAQCKSPLAEVSDVVIEIPWAFDESVCQTRTVSNLYTAHLMLAAFFGGNEALEEEIALAISQGDHFMEEYRDALRDIAYTPWENAVVLADSELEGIAEEGALAFKEICQLPSNYYHVLDVRHGPMVLINEKTLVIIALSPLDDTYQEKLIEELSARGAQIVTISSSDKHGTPADIRIVNYMNYGVRGIPFIFVPQALAYFKALSRGINPDEPSGLDPWIKL